MTNRVKANIRPALISWARETAGFSPAEAAARLKHDEADYLAWEAGDDMPSLPQLRRIAELYKRPLAVFYLPEPPTTFQVMRDLRRLPGVGFRRYPPGLQLELRMASERRELARELSSDLGQEPVRFSLQATLNDNPEDVGDRIRVALGVTAALQRIWRDADGRASFNAWRSRIEALGVLIFQTTRFETEDASGFAIADDVLPIIAVNRKDAPTRRTFSLLHELAHLLLRVSGVSDLETDAARPAEDQRLEVFCNQVAAAALMPRDLVLGDPRVRSRALRSVDWTDGEISDLARAFGVSREALLRRLLTFDRTTSEFYMMKRGQYHAERLARLKRQREEAKDGDGIPRNMPQETLSNFGRPLVQMIIGNYHQDNLTLSEVSGYLGLKAKHLPKLEQLSGFR
ncbi:MAG: ImmA/IrrE family metallo-endopeptidase [Mesorhizobium sp.]|uniref:XRE family transcriptional regulator n=1 Tax=Mesorhizobium sp. TaxID=1871066 RepID=UPI00120D2FF6|nr:XRE family transcriptional regulator [Mesorhizobium sp.]TIP23587.1 MAG: ImmA/IrrE family metallo-endopeptidase [Mesorhizobium sp.]